MAEAGTRTWHRRVAIRALVIGVALLMIGLTWDLTWLSIGAEIRASQTDAESYTTNLALAVQWPLAMELQALDRASLRISRQWDPATETLATIPGLGGLVGETSRDVAVLDAAGRVIAATRPERLGTSMAQHPAFIARRAGRAGHLFIMPGASGKKTEERWQIEVARRLEGPGGRFAGAVLALSDPSSLTGVLEQVDMGPRGLIALLPPDGILRPLFSDSSGPPQNVSASRMAQAARSAPFGVWTGPSAPDGVLRVHAFRRITPGGFTLIVGMDDIVAMRSAISWAVTARWFAVGITAAVAAITWLLWRGMNAAQRNAEQAETDRRRLEAAYRSAERARADAEGKAKQLDGVIAGMSDGVMLLDQDLRLALWNERYPLYAGVPRDMLRPGSTVEELLRAQARAGEFGPLQHEAEIAAEVERRAGPLRAGRIEAVRERTRPNGRSIEARRSALPGGGFVTLYTDITARHQTEAARAEALRLQAEAAEQKANFVAVVSHEIRTPLNAVLGSLALLDQSDLSASQRRLALAAREAGQALLDLVNDVLDMSRLEAGRLELCPSVMDLRALLSGIGAMFGAAAAARGIHIEVQADARVPASLWADGGRLRQVLVNLLSNAVKFAHPGPVVLRAAPCTGEDGRAMLRLAVCDSGPRLSAADSALLFRPFARLARTDRVGVPGTGLGLAICARIVGLMAGRIGVEDAPEGGNAFWLTLPLLPASAVEEAKQEKTAGAPTRNLLLRRGPCARILLVEDVAANAHITAALLRRAGHRVDIAATGEQAVTMAAERYYDLVFMDLAMPAMSGVEAVRAIRALAGPAGLVPIAALTATTSAEDRSRCEQAGVDAVLRKPASVAELVEAIGTLALSPRGGRPRARAWPRQAEGEEPDPGAIDLARLTELRGALAPEQLARLVDQCFADLRERLAVLREELASGCGADAAGCAHAVAGIAATYGLARLEARARIVMRAAAAGDLATARDAADYLDSDLRLAGSAMAAGLATLPA